MCGSICRAETYSGVCGPNVTWTLDEDGILTVSGTGGTGSFFEKCYAHDILLTLPGTNVENKGFMALARY